MPRSMGYCDPEDKMMCSSKIIHVYLFEIKRIQQCYLSFLQIYTIATCLSSNMQWNIDEK